MPGVIAGRPKMKLRELQRQFKSEVLLGQQSTDLQNLIEAGSFRTDQRINVYRNNIEATLVESLESIYPVSHALVGENYFRHMARAYVREHAPDTGDLRNYGEHLPQFMHSMPGTENFAYLFDIAKIDWACHISFHAVSEIHLPITSLSQFSVDVYESLLFTMNPAAAAVRSEFPIFDIWDYATSDNTDKPAPDINVQGQQVLICRTENTVKVVQIDQNFYDMFFLFNQQQTLATVFQSLLEANPEYNLQEGLNSLFAYGLVTEIKVDGL